MHRTPEPALPEDARAALCREYGSSGWVVPQALARLPAARGGLLRPVAQTHVPRWSRGRVVLLGDACSAVSLLAGQGASLGIAGAYVLGGQLARHSSVEDGLEAYEKVWRPVTTEKQQVARSGARWFLPASPLQLRARHVMMKLARLPGVDRRVTAALVGKTTGVIPELSTTGRP